MTGKAGTVLALGVGVLLLRFGQNNKLGRAWAALWGGSSGTGGSGTGGSGVNPGDNNASGGGGGVAGSGWGYPGTHPVMPTPAGSGPAFPNYALFGIPLPSWLSYGINYKGYVDQTILQGDQAEIAAMGSTFLADLDYGGIPLGSDVRLPGGPSQQYLTVRSKFESGVGYVEGFAPLSSTGQIEPGRFEYLHLTSDFAGVGTTHYGGELVGKSGQPLSSTYGSGSHLAVLVDQAGYDFLRALGM